MKIAAPLTSEPLPVLQRIEVASSFSIPSFHLIGLAGPEVGEARERARAAIEASGFEFPRRRVVVNLSPASIRKRGTGSDLAIALAVLESMTPIELPVEGVAWGELGLDGSIKPAGKLMRGLFAAWSEGADFLLLSRQEYAEARTSLQTLARAGSFRTPPPRLLAATTLKEAWQKLCALTSRETPYPVDGPAPRGADHAPDLPETPGATRLTRGLPDLLKLSPLLERLVGVAASGGHHLLLLGPQGSGKSQALEWLIALQPRPGAGLVVQHHLIRELSGHDLIKDDPGIASLGIRRIGAQCRPGALLGGATRSVIRPGEFSLAHGGLLVADELPEWARDSREALREPLERGRVTLTRAEGSLELPARFILAANGNLCGCGGWPPELTSLPADTPLRPVPCRCDRNERKQYLSRLSGPILDRLDVGAIIGPESPSTSPFSARERLDLLGERCARAREISQSAWGDVPGALSNATTEELLEDHPAWRKALEKDSPSLRSRHKILKVALSLAAWDVAAKNPQGPTPIARPESVHFFEAKLYRPETVLKNLRECVLGRSLN